MGMSKVMVDFRNTDRYKLFNKLLKEHTLEIVENDKMTYNVTLKDHKLQHKKDNGTHIHAFEIYSNQEVKIRIDDITKFRFRD